MEPFVLLTILTNKLFNNVNEHIRLKILKNNIVLVSFNPFIRRTAWAVFKYCGTKTVPLKKYEKIDFNLYQKKQTK